VVKIKLGKIIQFIVYTFLICLTFAAAASAYKAGDHVDCNGNKDACGYDPWDVKLDCYYNTCLRNIYADCDYSSDCAGSKTNLMGCFYGECLGRHAYPCSGPRNDPVCAPGFHCDQNQHYCESDNEATTTTKTTTTTTTTTTSTTTTTLCGNLKIFKFYDSNSNGVWDSVEDLLPGFSFNVKGPTFSKNVTTGSNGYVLLTCITRGPYTITEQVPQGWEVTTSNPQYAFIANALLFEVGFGNVQTPTTTTTTTTSTTTTTFKPWCYDSDGGYQIFIKGYVTGEATKGIPYTHRDYCVDSTTVAEWTCGSANTPDMWQPKCPATFCCSDGACVACPTTTTTTSTTTTTLPKGNLKIFKFYDLNENGIWDYGEDLLPGFGFNITSSSYFKQVVTGNNGYVIVPAIPYGTYKVTELVPTGWKVTTANPQYVMIDTPYLEHVGFGDVQIPVTTTTSSSTTTTTKATTTTTTSSTTTTTLCQSSLKIFKFNDLNGDGYWNAGEELLPGFGFNVSRDHYFRQVVTGSNGYVIINCIPFGFYKITEDVPAGWQVTTDNPQYALINTPYLNEVGFGNMQVPATTTTTTTTTTSSTTTTALPGQSCTDTDGFNIFLAGYVYGIYYNGTSYNNVDYCANLQNVVEWTCNSSHSPFRWEIACPPGWTCDGGKCLQSGTTTTTTTTTTKTTATTSTTRTHTSTTRTTTTTESPDDFPRRRMSIDEITILNDYVKAAEDLIVVVTEQNTGVTEIKEFTTTVMIPDLGIWVSEKSGRFESGEDATQMIKLNIPCDAAPGTYTVMVTVSGDSFRRVRYREIIVEPGYSGLVQMCNHSCILNNRKFYI